MKICFILDETWDSALTDFGLKSAKVLSKKYDVIVGAIKRSFAFKEAREKNLETFDILPLRGNVFSSLKGFLFLKGKLSSIKPDVVVSIRGEAFLFSYILRKKLGFHPIRIYGEDKNWHFSLHNICCGPTPIDLAVEDKTKGNFTDVAFVVLSTGENGKQDTTFSNKNMGGTLYYVATIEKPGETYDDIVEYMTLTDLRARTGSYPLYSVKNSVLVWGWGCPKSVYVEGGDYSSCTKIDNGSSFLIRDETVDVYRPWNSGCSGPAWYSISFDDATKTDANRNGRLILNGNCFCWWWWHWCWNVSLSDD